MASTSYALLNPGYVLFQLGMNPGCNRLCLYFREECSCSKCLITTPDLVSSSSSPPSSASPSPGSTVRNTPFAQHTLRTLYTERQRQCRNVASDIALIKLPRFLNKSSESLKNWVVTPIDQIWPKRWHWNSKSIVDAKCEWILLLKDCNSGSIKWPLAIRKILHLNGESNPGLSVTGWASYC